MMQGDDKETKKYLASKRGIRARRFGIWAERATLWLLWLRGWELVAWRQKIGRYELDLLVCRGKELRLVEVKARKAGAWSNADIAVTNQQRVRLQKALRAWLDLSPWPGEVKFQRASWSGLRCKFHTPEDWVALKD